MTTKRDARDDALIALLLSGRTVTQAAAELNISATTAYRAHARPDFQRKLGEALAKLWSPAASRSREDVMRCIDRLAAIRDDPDAKESDQIRASVAIIELATNLHDLVYVQPRLAAMEEKHRELSGESPGTDDPEAGS